MILKPGDQVRFLNEVGEGTVTEILAHDRVVVTTTEGFTQVMPKSNLVLINFTVQPDQVNQPSSEPLEPTAPPVFSEKIAQSLEPDNQIYLAVKLHRPALPFVSDATLYLVNNTDYDLLASCNARYDVFFKNLVHAQVPHAQQVQIGIFSQDELHQIQSFNFQFILFKDGLFKLRPPMEINLTLSTKDLTNERDWQKLDEVNGAILAQPILTLKQQDNQVDLSGLLEKHKQKEVLIAQQQTRKESKPNKFVIVQREKTIDLHIEQLVKDHTKMNNAQIIAHQLKVFEYEMDLAIAEKLHKLIVIHGVGSGVLKNSIREALKKYDDISIEDASTLKFGYGATQINFK